jgi:hypothetical protein
MPEIADEKDVFRRMNRAADDSSRVSAGPYILEVLLGVNASP